MTDHPAVLHLVLGEEELLIERAVAAVVAQARAATADPITLPVDRLRAGDAGSAELADAQPLVVR